jgi:hypothetical protein
VFAAILGKTAIVEWLLAEGGASVPDVDKEGNTVLLMTARKLRDANLKTFEWLLEHGGADITDTTIAGQTVWNLLRKAFVRSARKGGAERTG